MPSPIGYDYVLGSLHQAATAQLASSQLSHYLSDLQVNGSTQGGLFPLRIHTHRPLEKSASVPSSTRLTNSILSGRQCSGRGGFERLDSLEDPELENAPQWRPWSQRRHLIKYAPILKNFYEITQSVHKKQVKFADDVGLDLERTHFFTENPDYWEPEPVPRPDWFRPKSADAAMQDEDLVVEISEWQVNFSQPAADYLGFRERLKSKCVGLENVIIKHKANSFMGTIKVKNVSFKKDVFVRCSLNSWETFSDFPAKYCGKGSDADDKFDTFSFEIAVPTKTDEKHSVEFCIGFRTDGQEYWDSNSGRNYQLITNQMKQKKVTDKQCDAYAIHSPTDSWSQFASWHHQDTNRPYY